MSTVYRAISRRIECPTSRLRVHDDRWLSDALPLILRQSGFRYFSFAYVLPDGTLQTSSAADAAGRPGYASTGTPARFVAIVVWPCRDWTSGER